MSETFYKVLNTGGLCVHGVGRWHLPKGKRPGKWMPKLTGPLVGYDESGDTNGYYGIRAHALIGWIGELVGEIEYRGEVCDEGPDKVFGRQARLVRVYENWTPEAAAWFALDCTAHVLDVYEAKYPNDMRVRECILVSRQFLRGKATEEERASAAWAAIDAWVARDASAGEKTWQNARLLKYVHGPTPAPLRLPRRPDVKEERT